MYDDIQHVQRGDLVEVQIDAIQIVGRLEESLQPPNVLLTLPGFDTIKNRKALEDPEIERVALISLPGGRRDVVIVALQNRTGQWRDAASGKEFYVWPLQPTKDFPINGSSGSGHRQWRTKRMKKLRLAIEALEKTPEDCFFEARESVHDISSVIAEFLPLSATNLPRGYRLVYNLDDQRSLELAGELFSPTAADPFPSSASIHRLRNDLATGWLADLSEAWPEFQM